MTSTANSKRLVALAITSALATTALAGCTTKAPRADLAANKAQAALAKGKTGQAIENAEAAVMADPRNSAYRAMLGAAYMEAGRFDSAATAFDDAMALGDNSPRTALSYALAQAAMGRNSQAVAVLDDWRDDLDPADLGLALALAGEPDRGVHVLANALRGGMNTPKVRQNLAYAYALQGNWRSARLMASEDVPADQVGDRMALWASQVHPEAHQNRVAALLEVPLRADEGQPARLALENFPGVEQLAVEASALVPAAPEAPVREFADAGSYAGGELPPLEEVDPTPVVAVAQRAQPVMAVDAYEAPRVAPPESFETAFAAPAPKGATVAQVAAETVRFVSQPVVQKAPVRFGATPAPRVAGQNASRPAADGSHLIQLGSFNSEQGARRAWGIYAARWPELSNYEMVITEAKVRGKQYFRVSAGGFQQASASGMCGKVKARGQGCITWAEGKPLPGAIDTGTRMASR